MKNYSKEILLWLKTQDPLISYQNGCSVFRVKDDKVICLQPSKSRGFKVKGQNYCLIIGKIAYKQKNYSLNYEQSCFFLPDDQRIILHNEDGPAVLYRNESQYFLNGKEVTPEAIQQMVDKVELKNKIYQL